MRVTVASENKWRWQRDGWGGILMKWFKQEKKWKIEIERIGIDKDWADGVEVPKKFCAMKDISVCFRIILILPAAPVGRNFHHGILEFVSLYLAIRFCHTASISKTLKIEM